MYQTGGDLYSGQLSWNPLISFQGFEPGMMDVFGVRLHVGAFPIKNQTSDYSVGIDYQALWMTRFRSSSLEVGPGIQNFVAQGGSRITLNANLDFDFGLLKGLWKPLSQLVVGYSALLDPTYFMHQFRFGIGIQF